MFVKKVVILCLIICLAFVLKINAQEKILSPEELLMMSFEELMNVKITTAGKKEEKVKDIPASVVIVTRKDIETYGYQSLEEILVNIPGLYLIDDYIWTGTKNFGVRGFFSTGAFNDMVVLINGVNQRSDVLYDSYPTEKIAVPVEAIDKIEIVRGPMSVIYGSGAFFGVINIITNDISQKPSHIISTSLGYPKTFNIFAHFSGISGDFEYSFNSSIYQNDGIDEPFSKMMSDPSIATSPVEEGGWNLDTNRTGGLLKTNRKYFNFSGKFKDLSIDMAMVNSEKNAVETMFGAGEGNTVYFQASHIATTYHKKFSEKISLKTTFNYFYDNHWVDNELFFDHGYTNNWARLAGWNGEINAFIKPYPQLDMTLGASRRTVNDFFVVADYPFYGLPDTEIDIKAIYTSAFFAQMNYRFLNNLKLVAGARLERQEPYNILVTLNAHENGIGIIEPPIRIPYHYEAPNKMEITPRLALIYTLNKNNIFKFLYGKGIKQPSANNNLDLALNPGPTLKPAEIQTYELNYIATFSQKFSTNISIFNNDVDNLISRLNVLEPDEGLIIISSNAGKMSTQGIEVGIKITPIKELTIDLSTIYQDSKNKREGFRSITLGYSPQVLGYTKASYQLSPSVLIGLTGLYVGEMEAGWDMENSVDKNNHPAVKPDDPYNGRIGYGVNDHLTFDINLRIKKLFNTNLYLNGKISNFFDEEIYYPPTISNPQFDKGTLGDGRKILITLGNKF